MYKHGESVDEECHGDDNFNEDEDDLLGNDGIHFKDVKPALEKFKQAVENFEELSGKKCEVEARDLNGLTMRIKATHKN